MNDAPERFYGKYRGVVTSVTDPDALGRIQATLETFPGFKTNWCMPCVPYAGANVGFFFIPEVGAQVWIEFEGGDPSRAIWTGCYWTSGTIPANASPTRKTLQTKTSTIVLDDLQGTTGTLEIDTKVSDSVTAKITIDSTGITLTADKATITMSIADGITIAFPNSTVALAASQTQATVGSTTLTLTDQATTISSASISASATTQVQTSAGGASTSMTGSSFTLTAPTITLSGAAINIG
jgi:uncharacterized protein involved in type VI secretion and phage assembly